MTDWGDDNWRSEWGSEQRSEPWRTAAHDDADDDDFRAMLRKRRDFELMVGDDPAALTERQIQRAWELAGDEPWPYRMTEDEITECTGLARHL